MAWKAAVQLIKLEQDKSLDCDILPALQSQPAWRETAVRRTLAMTTISSNLRRCSLTNHMTRKCFDRSCCFRRSCYNNITKCILKNQCLLCHHVFRGDISSLVSLSTKARLEDTVKMCLLIIMSRILRVLPDNSGNVDHHTVGNVNMQEQLSTLRCFLHDVPLRDRPWNEPDAVSAINLRYIVITVTVEFAMFPTAARCI